MSEMLVISVYMGEVKVMQKFGFLALIFRHARKKRTLSYNFYVLFLLFLKSAIIHTF